MNISYKNYDLDKKFMVDYICYGKIILELKAVEELTGEHTAQVLNYLKASNLRLGLLVNFGKTKLQYRRVIL